MLEHVGSRFLKAFLAIVVVFLTVELLAPTTAEARAGRGRSVGRSYRSTPPASQPYRAPDYGRPSMPQGAPPAPMGSNRGGLFRGMAGGLAGGFLGSMLFSSLGHGAGMPMGGGGGGGLGFLEILLLGGLAYFGFRWFKARQASMAEATRPSGGASYAPVVDTIGLPYTPGRLAKAAAIDSEEASDLFFKVQGAWTRRDLSSVRPLLGPEVYEQLSQDVEELRSGQKINRLENITIREAQEINSWQEQGADHTTVRFRANLLDYTVDERSQALLEGSDSVPVKFNEDWTFAREATGQPWRLVGIEQIS